MPIAAAVQPSLLVGMESPDDYHPRPAALFRPERIILAKGSNSSPERRRLADRICAAYPRVEVHEQFSVPHNKIALEHTDLLDLHNRGRRTLVLGEHRSALGQSREEGNTCPNFWHFSPYGFCPFGCRYCYLAGTQGIRFSPTVKVFLNLEEILSQIDRRARMIGRPEAFYLGKLQDGMALDPLTGYSRTMIRFFAEHPFARLRILTKSAECKNVLDLDHRGHTVICWSLNPPAVRRAYEVNTPPVEQRIRAMQQCAEAGYPVRVMLMPIIPMPRWQEFYDELLGQLLARVKPDRITLGGICSYPRSKTDDGAEAGRGGTPASRSLTVLNNAPSDGRARSPWQLRPHDLQAPAGDHS